MAENKGKKQSMGKQKIEIKKIESKTHLQVTFSKRRTGLVNKVAELCTLCHVDAAVLVESPGGKLYSFGNPSVENVVNRYLEVKKYDQSSSSGDSNKLPNLNMYAEAMKALHEEKETTKKKDEGKLNGDGLFWWRKSTDNMELDELEEFKKALEGLKSEIMSRTNQISKYKILW